MMRVHQYVGFSKNWYSRLIGLLILTDGFKSSTDTGGVIFLKDLTLQIAVPLSTFHNSVFKLSANSPAAVVIICQELSYSYTLKTIEKLNQVGNSYIITIQRILEHKSRGNDPADEITQRESSMDAVGNIYGLITK